MGTPSTTDPGASATERLSNLNAIFAALRAPFEGEALDFVATASTPKKPAPPVKTMWAAYVDARAIQDRLDEAIGPDAWTVTYANGPSGDADYMATLSLRVGPREPDTGARSWVSKTDGAGAPARESVKGGYSTAFRRVATLWGIGRYLYGVEGVWLDAKIPSWEVGPHVWKRLPAWAVPEGSRNGSTPADAPPAERSDTEEEGPRPWLTNLLETIDGESFDLEIVEAFLQVEEGQDWRAVAYAWLRANGDGPADSVKARAAFVHGLRKLVREPATIGPR